MYVYCGIMKLMHAVYSFPDLNVVTRTRDETIRARGKLNTQIENNVIDGTVRKMLTFCKKLHDHTVEILEKDSCGFESVTPKVCMIQSLQLAGNSLVFADIMFYFLFTKKIFIEFLMENLTLNS
jgi:hypothetical protein